MTRKIPFTEAQLLKAPLRKTIGKNMWLRICKKKKKKITQRKLVEL